MIQRRAKKLLCQLTGRSHADSAAVAVGPIAISDLPRSMPVLRIRVASPCLVGPCRPALDWGSWPAVEAVSRTADWSPWQRQAAADPSDSAPSWPSWPEA